MRREKAGSLKHKTRNTKKKRKKETIQKKQDKEMSRNSEKGC